LVQKLGAKRFCSLLVSGFQPILFVALALADSRVPIFDEVIEMGMARVDLGAADRLDGFLWELADCEDLTIAPYCLDPFLGKIGRQSDAAIMLRWRGGYFPHRHWVASWFDVDVAAGRHLHRVDERVACFLLAL
jgi:hypothetical protein